MQLPRLSDSEFAGLIELGESRSVEFKPGGSRKNELLLAWVVRGVLAMSNTADGGWVILGIEERGETAVFTGLSRHDLLTWNQDDFAATVSGYVDAYVTATAYEARHAGVDFVVLRVRQFDDVPTLSKRAVKKPGHPKEKPEYILKEGAIYIRPRGKPESRELRTYAEMRELVELARLPVRESALQGLTSAAARLEAAVDRLAGASPAPSTPSDDELFDRQRDPLR